LKIFIPHVKTSVYTGVSLLYGTSYRMVSGHQNKQKKIGMNAYPESQVEIMHKKREKTLYYYKFVGPNRFLGSPCRLKHMKVAIIRFSQTVSSTLVFFQETACMREPHASYWPDSYSLIHNLHLDTTQSESRNWLSWENGWSTIQIF
jgi:hypothetical protein